MQEQRIKPGSIVEHDGEQRVVVDIAEDHNGRMAVLRYTDGDPHREVDSDGGDIHLTAVPVTELTTVDD